MTFYFKAVQTLLHFGTGIFKFVFLYCQSDSWQFHPIYFH